MLLAQFQPMTNGLAVSTLQVLTSDPRLGAAEVVLRARVELQPSLALPGYTRRQGFSALILGPAGITNHMEFSTNFIHWNSLTNFSSTATATVIKDGNALNVPSRYYRLRYSSGR